MRRPKTKKVDGSSEMDSEKQRRDINKIDKTILDNFYKLVHTQDNLRLTAAMSTFKIMVAMKKRTPEKFNEHLNYCVERLVTGLASSRALARRGYGTLLTELLKHYQFSTEKLLSIAAKKFGSISHESKDNLVAYYLLITIILESENYKWKANKDGEYAAKMYKCLRDLKFRKSYFDIPVSKLLVRYYSVFQPHMGAENVLERLAEPPIATLKHAQRKIEGLFNDCSSDVLCSYLDMLINLFYKEHGSEGKKLYSFCAKQMAHLIRRPQMIDKHEPVMKLAKFLVLNSLFRHVDTSKVQQPFWTDLGVKPSVELLGNNTKAALKTAYHATLDHIVSTCDALDRIKMLTELVLLADKLISHGAVKFLEPAVNAAQLWKAYKVSLDKHTSLAKKNNDPKILYPITGLYLFYGLQILEHGLESKEQLDDLSQSAKDALKDDPSDGSWADVLTDQIIAILSATECNPWIRRLCISIFGSLLPHISETSIDLICDVFKMPDEPDDEEDEGDDEGSEGKSMDVEKNNESSDHDHDDDDEEEGEEDEDGDEDGDEDEDEDSDEDDDKMSTCDEEPDRARKLEEAIKNSLEKNGLSAKQSGNEEEEEYLDDEQMMKLDSVIADMFKMNRVGKKNKKDPSFQLRCLDLVKKILQKKHSDGELIRKVLSVIVPYASKCRRYKELRPIAEKISKMVAKLSGKANLKQRLQHD